MQLSSSIHKNYFKKYRRLILISISIIAIIVIIFVLNAPIIRIRSTETQTRTINLQFNSQVYDEYGNVFTQSLNLNDDALYYPSYVSVINLDSTGGTFSVTMNQSSIGLNQYEQPWVKLENTTTQYMFIGAGATQNFSVPENWGYVSFYNQESFAYSVTAPTTQENYNVTITEYKSILGLVGNSWICLSLKSNSIVC